MALTTTVFLMCSVLGTNPTGQVQVDQVELIEYNHFYDEQGRHVFDQVLFYDWSPREMRYQIRDWRLIKTATQAPHYDVQRDLYIATWHDGTSMRQVRGKSIRESWTQYDPELVERSFLPKENRRELSDVRRIDKLITLPVAAP